MLYNQLVELCQEKCENSGLFSSKVFTSRTLYDLLGHQECSEEGETKNDFMNDDLKTIVFLVNLTFVFLDTEKCCPELFTYLEMVTLVMVLWF